MAEKNVRELIVTELKELTSGTTGKGDPYVLFQVRATYPDGRVIPDMKLRTFEELPVNEVIKVRIERADSERFGVSYTLFQVAGEKKAITRQVEELRARMAKLEGLLAQLMGVEIPAGGGQSAGPSGVAAGSVRAQPPIGPPVAEPPPLAPSIVTQSGEDDSDIPF